MSEKPNSWDWNANNEPTKPQMLKQEFPHHAISPNDTIDADTDPISATTGPDSILQDANHDENQNLNYCYELIVIQQPFRAKALQDTERESGKSVNPPIILQLGCRENHSLNTGIEKLGDFSMLTVSSALVSEDGLDCSYVLTLAPPTSPLIFVSAPRMEDPAASGAANPILGNTSPTRRTSNSGEDTILIPHSPGRVSNTSSKSKAVGRTSNLAPLVCLPTRMPPEYTFWRPDKDSEAPPFSAERSLDGMLVSPSHVLTDLDGRRGVYFVFVEIMVRVEGTYKLKFNLHDLKSTIGRGACRSLSEAQTKTFISFNARDYQTLQQQAESSELSKHFAEQGLIIPIRTKARKKRGVFTGVIQGTEETEEE
ncbi:hypothetical protein SmJEL517_g05823 [Synchytrium microbalum]|uniref:Velvet domain-containing protein n=1 Tax=Synchytrium microbalum TaxID=1806994 RepID=A0A507BUJ1_9FUNG|nr:uncharacterized protein SmJEL517_g05823 [Synchytrium microbalum]TPX30669.1 hypothetical protein SmJEL517_g05823 [Synchytrium microbalum]